jgi:hypothetical protein
MRTSHLIVAGAGIAVAVVTGSAFTDSNSMPDTNTSVAGYGETTATGAAVTKVEYNPQASNNTYLKSVVFTTSTDVESRETTLTLKDGTTPITVGASSAKFVSCSNGTYDSTAHEMTITCTLADDLVSFEDFDHTGLTVVQ